MTKSPQLEMPEARPAPKPMKTGVVTFLDVLGWKGIYNREQDPINRLARLINVLSDRPVARGLSVVPPEIKSISDTVVIYSTNIDIENASREIDVHGALCATAIAASIESRIPVRGATAFGEFEVHESIYVGKAIDEAASWYQHGDWIGVHLTPSANFVVDAELQHWTIYDPPLKAGTTHPTQCVIWNDQWSKAVPHRNPRKRMLSVFRDMGPITPDFAMKFINTLAYFDVMASRGSG